MDKLPVKELKQEFSENLRAFVQSLGTYVSTEDGQWTVKGFIDVYKNIYTISSDTKIVSKILEIHIFPKVLDFAEQHGYALVLADHQNYYPDISFVSIADERIKFAVDFKTTYVKRQLINFSIIPVFVMVLLLALMGNISSIVKVQRISSSLTKITWVIFVWA